MLLAGPELGSAGDSVALSLHAYLGHAGMLAASRQHRAVWSTAPQLLLFCLQPA